MTAGWEIGLDRTKLLITEAHDAKVDSVAGELDVLTEHEVNQYCSNVIEYL